MVKFFFQLTQDAKNEFRRQIEEKFEAYKQNFNQGRENYNMAMNNLMDSVHVLIMFIQIHCYQNNVVT
jgi:hypothetical protein